MFANKSWGSIRKKKAESPQSCPSLESDSSELSHSLGDIQLRTSSLDINGLLSAVNNKMGYESDEESIQASPILNNNDSFGPLQFEENKKPTSFVRSGDAEPQGPISGPVTGSNSALAPKLATVPEKPSTINFTKQTTPKRNQYHQSFDDHSDFDGDDDEELPFAATRQMASKGMSRTILPEISTGIVMTNDKFETYRKSLNSLQMLNRQNSLISNAASDDDDDDDEEADIELTRKDRLRKQEVALARQQQEAHLSVHRQKMGKMVGGEVAPSTTYDQVDKDDDDIMEDVPLSILRAHGFPKAAKKRNAGSSSPEMAGFDGSTAAGAALANRSASPGLPGANRNSQMLPPVFRDSNTFAGGKGLVGEIAREEEAKRNRISRSGNSTTFEGGLPYVDSRQSIPTLAGPSPSYSNPMLNDIRMQMQQMSEMQYQIMQMASSGGVNTGAPVSPDAASIRMGYSRAASIRSYGAPQPYSPVSFSPSFNNAVSTRPSVQDLHSYRARPVRPSPEDEDEDEDEAWRKFAEKRQSLKSQWISAE